MNNTITSLDEFLLAQQSQQHAVHKSRSPSQPSIWKPPLKNVTKFNFDEVMDSCKNRGSIAWIARDDEGRPFTWNCRRIPYITNPKILEAMACREAISFASRNNNKFLKEISFWLLKPYKRSYKPYPLRTLWLTLLHCYPILGISLSFMSITRWMLLFTFWPESTC